MSVMSLIANLGGMMGLCMVDGMNSMMRLGMVDRMRLRDRVTVLVQVNLGGIRVLQGVSVEAVQRNRLATVNLRSTTN